MLRLTMENIAKNAISMENTIACLKTELNVLKQAYIDMRIKALTKENYDLTKQIEDAKSKLVKLETSHGIKQISIPAAKTVTQSEETSSSVSNNFSAVEKNTSDIVETNKVSDAAKEKPAKKEKKAQPAKKPSAEQQSELPVDVGRLDLRVGQIMEVEKHPDADSLYVSKIQCGDPALRTVVSGLVKFVPIDELRNRKVVVLCNLKPVKMRGVSSEAMVMCASTPEAVEVLSPPSVAEPGDFIDCSGYVRQPDAQLNPKKKIFEAVAPDLKTNDSLQACYKGSVLTVGEKGPVTAKSLKNVQIK